MAQQTFDELADAVMQAESRGKRYAADGKTLTTSAKGALGEMQVMPKTSRDPGFGVVPVRDQSPDEIARVGRDYLQAMMGKYGNMEKALVAYNMGPGSTDKWIAAGAKLEKLPEETRTYVQRVKGILGNPVSRETKQEKKAKPAESLPSLPPMAAVPAVNMKEQMSSLGPGYQAALALSFLSDTDENEDRDTEKEPGIAEQFLADTASRPSAMAQFADFKIRSPFAEPVQPQMLADGGIVYRAEGSPEKGEVEQMQDVARKSEAYQALEKYLQSRNEMPDIKISKDLYAGGAYNSDNLNIGSGTVEVNKNTSKEYRPSILAHEMTHAADRQMRQQAIEQGMFGNSNQYTEAYEKLVGPDGEKRIEFVRRLNPEYAGDNRLYRTSSREIPAHGVGAFVEPTQQGSSLPHLDATAATELQILLDLAQRNVDKGPTGLAKIPAFIRKMGRYSNGGEVEQEGEESLDTYYAPKARPSTGLNRKEGPISQALNSGEAYLNIIKGVSEMPYNLAGAPMDLVMLARQALTGQAPAGQVGTSDYIKKKMTELGIRPAPPTDPTAKGFYTAGDLLSNVVNPAGVARAGVKGAQAVGKQTGEAAKAVAKDFQQYNQQLSVPGASYAVRNRGTPFVMGYGPTRGPDGTFPAMDQAEKYIKEGVAITNDPKLNDWLSSRLTAYLRRDFATPDDQFVKAADANQLLHFVNKPMKRTDLDPYYERIQDISSLESLPYVRRTEGFDQQGLAKTPYGKRAEDLIDNAAWPLQLEDISSPGMIPRGMDRTDPSARLTELGVNIDDMLQFDKLADDMSRMRNMPGTYSAYSQPGVKVPDEYLLTDEMLVGLTPAQASNRVAKFRNWEEDARQKMASKALFEDPSIRRTPAEGGGVWINPDDLAENPNMRNLVQDVGCDGGWCTKDEGSALHYGSDENRLSILMDNKARPQAQLTITSRQYQPDDFLSSMTDSEAVAFKAKYPDIASYNGNAIMNTPEFQQSKAMNPDGYSITEIKGTNNRTDFENAPYLKQIQQQVKNLDSQFRLNDVKNLDKIGMTQLPKNPRDLLTMGVGYGVRLPLEKAFGTESLGLDAVRKEAIRLNNGSQYTTGNEDDVAGLLRRALGNVLTPQQRASGGMIERQSTDSRRYL